MSGVVVGTRMEWTGGGMAVRDGVEPVEVVARLEARSFAGRRAVSGQTPGSAPVWLICIRSLTELL